MAVVDVMVTVLLPLSWRTLGVVPLDRKRMWSPMLASGVRPVQVLGARAARAPLEQHGDLVGLIGHERGRDVVYALDLCAVGGGEAAPRRCHRSAHHRPGSAGPS